MADSSNKSDPEAKEDQQMDNKRATKHHRMAHKDDDEEEDHMLYIPRKDDASRLVKISPSRYPEIKKYLSLTKPELQKWLRHNAQLVTGRKHELLLRCVDGQINGRLPGCPKCHHGQFHYDYTNSEYVCNGYWDEMARTPIRCGNRLVHLERKQWHDLEKDGPAERFGREGGEHGTETKHEQSVHHKEHPDHHHQDHDCKVEANHQLVDLLEDLAYYHSVLKDDHWNYKARAFISAARAVEGLDFEVKDAKSLGDSRDEEHHVERIGKSSAEAMQSF